MEPQQEEGYISVKEAAKRIDYSLRQTDRFIKAGKLEAVHHSRSLRKVSVASVEAFNREHGRRPTDPLRQVREQHAALQRRCMELEAQERLLKGEIQQGREARLQLERIVAALTAGIDGQDLEQLIHGLARHATSSHRQPPFARRGYPPGTVRLAPFAELHGIEPSTLRRQAEKSPELATIYERLAAEVNKREWWLLPEQQPLVIAYWQAHGIPYTPCLDCPHGGNATGEQGQTGAKEATTT
jgi:hypothetical protein